MWKYDLWNIFSRHQITRESELWRRSYWIHLRKHLRALKTVKNNWSFNYEWRELILEYRKDHTLRKIILTCFEVIGWIIDIWRSMKFGVHIKYFIYLIHQSLCIWTYCGRLNINTDEIRKKRHFIFMLWSLIEWRLQSRNWGWLSLGSNKRLSGIEWSQKNYSIGEYYLIFMLWSLII